MSLRCMIESQEARHKASGATHRDCKRSGCGTTTQVYYFVRSELTSTLAAGKCRNAAVRIRDSNRLRSEVVCTAPRSHRHTCQEARGEIKYAPFT